MTASLEIHPLRMKLGFGPLAGQRTGRDRAFSRVNASPSGRLRRLIWRLVLLTWALLLVWRAPTGHAGVLAQFRTGLGDLDVELFDRDKPITVRNFIRYVQNGRYRDSILHRCPVNVFTGLTDFVIQGGGFFLTTDGTSQFFLDPVEPFENIPNEFGVGRRFSNAYGTIAMAKARGDTNSASSQWFFNLKSNSFLDAPDTNNLFVVFGRTLRGTNVLNQFIGRSYGDGLVNLDPMIRELPVHYAGFREPRPEDLYFVDISLLTVRLASIDEKLCEVSWDSVRNVPNVIEYTEVLPPAWQSLISTNGTGETMSVLDRRIPRATRIYRVRVDF